MEWLIGIGVFWAVWTAVPVLILMALGDVPWKHRRRGAWSLLKASPKGFLVFIPDILAPIVVPIALIFTRWDADHLPRIFKWWDNDVSINGDRDYYWPLEYQGGTYYSRFHPRSYLARLNWLVLRNRASMAALMIGHTYQPGENQDREYWGDKKTNRDHEGWVVYRAGSVYQLYKVVRFGRVVWRLNWGHKVWDKPFESGNRKGNVAMVVTITFSIMGWTGTK